MQEAVSGRRPLLLSQAEQPRCSGDGDGRLSLLVNRTAVSSDLNWQIGIYQPICAAGAECGVTPCAAGRAAQSGAGIVRASGNPGRVCAQGGAEGSGQGSLCRN